MSTYHYSRRYLREKALPTPFCPGCGNGIVINAFLKAVSELGYTDLKDFVFVSGIGCGAWIISPHFNADTIHVTHGRAIPVATGVKLIRPDLNVVVISGDGDLINIGGNHLIHAARRNIGLKVILVNNMTFGMTGGQASAGTLHGLKTTTTPYGNIEHPFDISQLMIAAGASYVARWTTYHMLPLANSIKRALTTDGFAFVEVISQCPTALGRRINLSDGIKMLTWFKEISVPISKAKKMSKSELANKIIVGEFVKQEREPFEKQYLSIITKAKKVITS
ncbi:MAG: thiamine pyrophosphate-dependent enzyme [Candidatus Asgardarchaeia archaeon]